MDLELIKAIGDLIGNVGFPIGIIVLMIIGFCKLMPEIRKVVEAHVKLVDSVRIAVVEMKDSVKSMAEDLDEIKASIQVAMVRSQGKD